MACRRPWVSHLGPVDQTAHLPETPVAFAGAGRASTETAIAFAGAKWAFWVRFSVAEVMVVSMIAVQGRALVMVVSRWSASAVAVVMVVSKSPRCCALCAKKFALRRCVIVKARKSSPCVVIMAQNWRFLACWAIFFAETWLEGLCWAKFFAETRLEGACWASFFAIQQSCDPVGRTLSRRSPGSRLLYWQC